MTGEVRTRWSQVEVVAKDQEEVDVFTKSEEAAEMSGEGGEAHITENSPIRTEVVTVETTDKDTGENAEVSLELAENSGNKFKIDSVTGEILVTGSLDREEQDEYLLKVVATDRAWRPETSVGINIQDMNDNSPVFDKSEYMMIFPPSGYIINK